MNRVVWLEVHEAEQRLDRLIVAGHQLEQYALERLKILDS